MSENKFNNVNVTKSLNDEIFFFAKPLSPEKLKQPLKDKKIYVKVAFYNKDKKEIYVDEPNNVKVRDIIKEDREFFAKKNFEYNQDIIISHKFNIKDFLISKGFKERKDIENEEGKFLEDVKYISCWIDANNDNEVSIDYDEEVVVEITDRIDPKKLNLSQKGIDFLKAYESEVKENGKHVLYNDDAGYCTIGYGHLVEKKSCSLITDIPEEFKNGLSDEKAENLFRNDLKSYEGIVKNRVKVNLYQHEFDALVVFVFNLGEPNFRKSKLLEKINEKKYDEAPELFSRFTQSGGKVMTGLVLRRKAEAKIFKDAVYDSTH